MRIARLSLNLRRMGWQAAVCSGLCLSASLACGGAELRSGVVYDHPVYYVDEPHGVSGYPSAQYRGRPAYLVDDRWYYSTPKGWVVFREEPRELRAFRERRYRPHDRSSDAPRRAEPTQSRRYHEREPEPASPSERRRRTAD
jgi:hypothetical protein